MKKNRHQRRFEDKINSLTKKQLKKRVIKAKKSTVLTPKQQSLKKKINNVQKHLTIAKATQGSESQGHIEKAGKLIEKYGFK